MASGPGSDGSDGTGSDGIGSGGNGSPTPLEQLGEGLGLAPGDGWQGDGDGWFGQGCWLAGGGVAAVHGVGLGLALPVPLLDAGGA